MVKSAQRAKARTDAPVAPDDSAHAGAASALALAATTAVLKHLIENGLAHRGVTAQLGGDVLVSALPPDRIGSGADERPQLNLFLYHTTPHTALRALGGAGAASASGALVLDLHYLVSAYGAHDFQTEILLGHALQLLHARPVVERAEIDAALAAVSADGGHIVPPPLAALRGSDFAERVHELRITPAFLSGDEMSKLWSALQAKYRPSATYRVSSAVLAGPATR